MKRTYLGLVFIWFGTAMLISGDEPSSKMKGYDVSVLPANIALTVASMPPANVEVFGQPRMTKGHPCTLWDQEDVDHYKDMLKTSKELQILVADLKGKMDARMAEKGKQPEDIPAPQKGKDGNWLFPGEYYPPTSEDPQADAPTRFRDHFCRDTEVISNLGILYALTGEAKYGEYARKLLLAYANFTRFSPDDSYNLRSHIGITTDTMLEEGLKGMRLANGYDLIYNLPSWTAEDRKRIHDDLFKPWASTWFYPSLADKDPTFSHSAQANNRGVFTSAAALMAGYATEDEELVNAALYGIRATVNKYDATRTKEWPSPKDWVVATKENPSAGLMTVHFADPCLKDRMWVEGSPSYTLYALCGMINAAETAWHHDIDLYRYNNCIFKSMFDYPLLVADPDMSCPSLNDSVRFHLEALPFPASHCGQTLYEYAYRRYRDPLYLRVINNPTERAYQASLTNPATQNNNSADDAVKGFRTLSLSQVGSQPPSLLFDLDINEGAKGVVPQQPNVNYPKIGFGVLRVSDMAGTGINSLILSSGPTILHGHPDKLGIDLFAFNDELAPDPGSTFPKAKPINLNWYATTLAHNTLTVDETDQWDEGHLHLAPKGLPHPHADQLVYAPASTFGMQRAWTDSVYTDTITQDRSIFLTREYMADLFGVFAQAPHKYDLAWHIKGDVKSNLKFEPMKFPEPTAIGYNTLTNVRQSKTDQNWSVALTRDSHVARLMVPGGNSTQVIVGDGGPISDITLKKQTAPTILERRENVSSTLYGNAVDISDAKDGFVKSVSQEGGLEAGYGLLKVETTRGTDLCFTSYRPGNYKAGGLETDALQALVIREGMKVQSLYLAGGKELKIKGGSISRSEAGLAYIEKLSNGNYIISNPSSTAATVTVTLPALSGLKAFQLDENGQRTDTAGNVETGGAFTAAFKSNSKVELAPAK